MPLAPGSKLDSYEIVAPLGAGGMGEVYRARDLSLKREVAIKVLPEYWSRDPDRLSRFQLEAQAAAALNHPNIVSIYHVGEYEQSPYIVTELLQGETLRDRLRRGPLRTRELLDWGIEIARGLGAAHASGIVHRDLKPENIFITRDARVKILDFGLARFDETKAAAVDGDTVTIRHQTSAGQAMGTAAYMSPEQVRGDTADARSDIFSLGLVLYEMATGHRAFRKPTPAETMTAILHEDPPPIAQSTQALPPGLQKVLSRCLAKDPQQRFQHAADLAFALDALSDASGVAQAPPRDSSTQSPRYLWIAAVLVLVALIAVGLFWWTRPPAEPIVQSITQLTDDETGKIYIQTDGSRVYFNEDRQGSLQIAQVSVKGGQAATIPTTIANPAITGISPDGSTLLALQGGMALPRPVWEIPLPAGDARRMGNLESHEANFTPDGRLLLCRVSDLLIADKDGSNPHKILTLKEGHFGGAEMSPDGRRIVFTHYGEPDLYVTNSDGSGTRLLAKSKVPGGFCCARWTPDGQYIVFSTRFPIPRQDLWYMRMSDGWPQHPSEPKRLTAGPLSYWMPLPSRDGKSIFAIGTKTHREAARYDIPSGKLVPFMPGVVALNPTFSADGEWLAYNSPDGSLWRSRSNGQDPLQLTYPPQTAWGPVISPDGKWVCYHGRDSNYIISIDGRTPRKLTELPPYSGAGDWSPDANLLVFSDSSTGWQEPDNKVLDLRNGQVALLPGGKLNPLWAGDGKLVGTRRDGIVLQIFDPATQQWSDLSAPQDGPVVAFAHSPDFKYFYYTTGGQDPRIFRVHMPDLKTEVIASLKDVRFPGGARYTGINIAPGGAVIFTYEVGTQEIYALDVKWP